MRRIAALALAALALAASPLWADLERGVEAYRNGDFEGALAAWLPLAEAGDAEAQYRVGLLHYYGRGVPQDYVEAARWYRRAADQGHARSQSNLGLMFETGRGVEVDEEQAAAWYTAAARQGRAVAQYSLGRLCEEGRGVARDAKAAAEWYERAAKQDYAEAQLALARLLDAGSAVERDTKAASRWRRRAARQGAIDRGLSPGVSVENIEAPNDGPADPVASRAAASSVGDAEPMEASARYEQGRRFLLGLGVPRDPDEAARWLRSAASEGHGQAAYDLALIYYRGRGKSSRRDYLRACYWFGVAAQSEIGDAADWRERIESKLSDDERAELDRLETSGAIPTE